MPHNNADTVLDLAIAVAALSLGSGVDSLLSADTDSQYI